MITDGYPTSPPTQDLDNIQIQYVSGPNGQPLCSTWASFAGSGIPFSDTKSKVNQVKSDHVVFDRSITIQFCSMSMLAVHSLRVLTPLETILATSIPPDSQKAHLQAAQLGLLAFAAMSQACRT